MTFRTATRSIVSTQVIGFRRMWARRRSEFHAPGSERPLALAITDWVLLNARGMPTRVPAEIADAVVDAITDFTPIRLADFSPPADAQALQLAVRRSELDPMAHVNNAAYLDYLDEQYFADADPRTPLVTPRRYRAEFIASAEPHTQLVGRYVAALALRARTGSRASQGPKCCARAWRPIRLAG